MAFDLSRFKQIEAGKLVDDLEKDPNLFAKNNYFLYTEIQPGVADLIRIDAIERTETGNCAIDMLYRGRDMIEATRVLYYTKKAW